jgi:hypothetical protein
MNRNPPLDPTYFSEDPWHVRVRRWLDDPAHADSFLDGNVRLVRQIMEHPESGLRVVLNISAHALLAFLAERRYRKLYEHPVIGGVRRGPSPERVQVDQRLGFGADARHYYFGAVALGGTGVRFYGEYCMVLKPDAVDSESQILDRDSYDLLLPPLSNALPDVAAIVRMLQGRWTADAIDMLTLKLLPEVRGAHRLITTGTVSEMILHDQEFVEVHLRKPGAFSPDSIEEVRQSPDEVAIEARILARSNAGFPPTAVEVRWLNQREHVVSALETEGMQYRVVTLHGRGYQWR